MASEDLAAPSSASARAKNDIIGVADSPNDQVDVKEGTLEHDEHGNYKRSITPRHMHVRIALRFFLVISLCFPTH